MDRDDVTLPWDKFSDWLHCICIVTFDLELGQALETVYPGHAKLTEKEKMNICYLAFPDSNSGCMGDTCFSFRMRRFSAKHLKPVHTKFNRRAPLALQIRDKTIPRGYLQKSLVLVSQFPFWRLFEQVVQTIAPEFFESGEPGIEAACHDIDQWAKPNPGSSYSLPLMGSVVHCRLPSRSDPPHVQKHPAMSAENGGLGPSMLLPSVFESEIYESFASVLPHVQLLWELVLIGEPLVVMASSPTICSKFVQSLVNLIWPLRYCQDFRPFFTIHDSEFKEYTSRTQPPPNLILGVTNPFFAKTLQHWPNIVRLGEADGSQNSSPSSSSQRIMRGGDLRTLDSRAGVYTQYKPFLAKDKALLKRLFKGGESMRPVEVQSAILKRHFLEITQSFMIPLERYIASLMPLQKQISPFKSAPEARQFDFEEFLSTLNTNGPNLTSPVKGDWIGLYRKFVTTKNFEGWFQQRQKEVSHKLQLLHLEVLCAAEFDVNDLDSRHEVEIVDLVLKLRDKMHFVERNSDSIKPDLAKKLRVQMETVLSCVSDDLRAVILSNEKNIQPPSSPPFHSEEI